VARVLAGRLALSVPMLLGMSVLVFLIIRLVPGDPVLAVLGLNATPDLVAKLREDLGLNDPIYVQYVNWLAGVLHGLEQQQEPPPALTGNAYAQKGEPLPISWPQALERFAGSSFARAALGSRFVDLYTTVRRAEMEEFSSWITPLEIQRYMGPL